MPTLAFTVLPGLPCTECPRTCWPIPCLNSIYPFSASSVPRVLECPRSPWLGPTLVSAILPGQPLGRELRDLPDTLSAPAALRGHCGLYPLCLQLPGQVALSVKNTRTLQLTPFSASAVLPGYPQLVPTLVSAILSGHTLCRPLQELPASTLP